MTTRKLRLGPLPKTESTKLTFACPASLKADLDRYATLHAQTYGEAVDATVLIPHMLEAFMVGDRGFRKGGAGKAAFRWRPSLKRAAQGCAFFILEDGDRLGYEDQTRLPPAGNRPRCSTLGLSTAKLLCGSQPTTPQPRKAARSRAKPAPHIDFRPSG